MILASLICFGVLVVGLTVLYGLFGEKNNTTGVILCGALMVSLVAFCLTLLNFTTLSSAVVIFFPLGLMGVAISELVQFVQIEEKTKKLIKAFFLDVALGLFAVGIIVLGEFNFIGLLCGELVGLCIGLLFWAIKKTTDKLEITASLLGYVIAGMMLGGCIWNVICATHLVTSILTLAGAGLVLAFMILKSFENNNAKIRIAQRVILSVALILMTISVYFF